MPTEFALVPAEALREADALWLVSSTRLAAPVVALDDVAMPVDKELTAAMNEYLAARTS
jgi:4-amino-4-deoxychorismate lyase